ncbi:Ras protein Rap 1b [Pelomyxa schiedti]|nr:Ras protein Rap 1b [Pelomyxa schiedti]
MSACAIQTYPATPPTNSPTLMSSPSSLSPSPTSLLSPSPSTSPSPSPNALNVPGDRRSRSPSSGDDKAKAQKPVVCARSDEFTICVLGSGSVGKSALTISFVQNHFVEVYDPTIEDSYRKQISVDEVPCILHILDTAGQEEYSALRDRFIRNGQGFLLVFSMTSLQTFQELPPLHTKLLQVKDVDSVPFILVGNKIDLADQLQVTQSDAEDFASKQGMPFFATSAKNRVNVDQVFLQLVREMRKCPLRVGDGSDTRKPSKRRCTLL